MLGGIGGQLVQRQREALRGLRAQDQRRPTHDHAIAEGAQFALGQLQDIGALPFLVDQKDVRLTERMDAVEHGLLRLLDRALARKAPRDHGLDHREQVLGAVMQLAREQIPARLGLLALGDVARDLRCADDPARSVPDGRHGERDVEPAAILVAANGLVMVDALTAPDAVEYAGLLVVALGRYEDGHGLANDLIGFVAEEPLRRAVPAGDDAIEILADDRVVGRLHYGGQPLHGVLGALGLGQVNQHVHGADEIARCVMKRRGVGHERHARAVGPLGHRFHAPHRQAALEGLSHRTLVVRQGRAIRPIELPRAAPFALADLGLAAP